MSDAQDQSRYDIAIIGAGFAGSILAHVLAKSGLSVALIDAVDHPRFAIGESSTPIADKILRRLGEKHSIEAFVQLSTFGSWQANHPEVTCGLKRGFSYYAHQQETPFEVTSNNSLLVTASASDDLADTHWYRSEVDEFLFDQAAAAGATPLVNHRVTKLVPGDWVQITLDDRDTIDQGSVFARMVVDASGPSRVMAKLLGATDLIDSLQTNTRSEFAHFSDVGSWSESHSRHDDPFDCDAAAQHHLLGNSWLWMLRFANGITSVGITTPTKQTPTFPIDKRYPSLAELFTDAKQVAPTPPQSPVRTQRLQRFFDPIAAPNCLMLPTAAVSIDPLHSTGIAHALAGIDRFADMILNQTKSLTHSAFGVAAEKYAHSVRLETRFLDSLVATAYENINDFTRFTAASMLYFASAIICEERYDAGETPSRLFNSDNEDFVAAVQQSMALLSGNGRTEEVIDEIRSLISPYNTVGLFDSHSSNRYRYTATK
jgi:FADH2 O2-dependent halogenase